MSEDIVCNLSSVAFDIYTSEEIRKISVKQITNPVAFDKLGRPTVNGLYDIALGISPYVKSSNCATCGLDSVDCTGHIGHIELPACVYNPFSMNYLAKLLNSKCFNCNRLRIRDIDKKKYTI